MILFEGASEFVIHGGQFGHVTYQLGHDDSSQSEPSFLVSAVMVGFIYSHRSSPVVRRLVEKDSSLNQYSVEHGTVTIPRFSKSLLLQDLQVDPDVGRISKGSCSFDLLVRLGLFPEQPNESLAEYDTKVPLDAVVSRGNCYCGRISRHGFVFLVSKYFQHVSVAEMTTSGTCFILSTTIGRFKCYEIDDRYFIHFDSGTRSSYVDLVKNQNIDDILRTARGEYQVASGVSPAEGDNVFEWHRSTGEPLESIASGQFYGVPNAVIYMTRSILQRWKRIKEFGFVMLDTVLSVLDGLDKPVEFVSALRNLPPVSDGTRAANMAMGTLVEQLASSIYLFRSLLHSNRIGTMSYKGEFFEYNHQLMFIFLEFHSASTLVLLSMFEAHKYFRGPKVELKKLLDTSHKRFLKILDGFPTLDDLNSAGRLSKDHIQKELFAVLDTNKNNVALVAIQGYIAVLLQWNASRILLRAREAPEEWIRFVGADDDELFLG